MFLKIINIKIINNDYGYINLKIKIFSFYNLNKLRKYKWIKYLLF